MNRASCQCDVIACQQHLQFACAPVRIAPPQLHNALLQLCRRALWPLLRSPPALLDPRQPGFSIARHHRYPVGREIPNSSHNAVRDFSCRVAATTNRTFCSSASIVFHGILALSAPVKPARECKGSPGTFCKACHETGHAISRGWASMVSIPSTKT